MTDFDHLAAAFENAGLDIPADRLAEKRQNHTDTLALIAGVSKARLGETAPAAAFKAQWD